MKLNWFSPLPPARTDIGHYTARILPALSREADVTLWTDQAEWDAELERYATVRQYQPDRLPWPELNRADVSFYNIGNNAEFHLAIWQVSSLQPGIVVLHDFCLQEFFAYVYRWLKGDRDGYINQMGSLYGEMGRIDADLWWNDQLSMAHLIERYPLTPLALADALGVVVHTEHALTFVKRKGYPVAFAPLPFAATTQVDRGSQAQHEPPYRLIVFGYIHRNRRLESLLDALAGMPEKRLFRLDIYGQLSDEERVRAQIAALGLADAVSIHGFVPEPELDAALGSADLAVNLRFPSMGEASGSQLRIWNHALPSLVTRVGAYASLPEETVAFVRPEHEVADIQTHLRAFLRDPIGYARIGERGRRRLEQQHAPDVYVRAVIDFAAHAQCLRLGMLADDMVERVADQLGSWVSPAPPSEMFRRLAEGIALLTST